MTIDTPHAGSPLANLLVAIRDEVLGPEPDTRALFIAAMAASGHPVDRGAIDDLAIGSAAINAIEAAREPGHAVVGIGGSDALELAPGWLGSVYTFINFFAETSDLFQGVQHDFVVGRQSQEGGLPPSAQFVIGGHDGIHTEVTGSTTVANHVIDVLNSPASGPLFSEFPAPRTLSASHVSEGAYWGQARGVTPRATTGLTISSPPSGTAVMSGQTVRVSVDADPAPDLSRVLLLAPDSAQLDDVAPFEFTFSVPAEAAGTFPIIAVGTDGRGNFFGSEGISLVVNPSGTLKALRLPPLEPVLFSRGETRQLYVLGEYEDGAQRDLTSASTGTVYASSNPNAVDVSAGGVLTAKGRGLAVVTVQSGGVRAVTLVWSVDAVCGNTVREEGEECDDGNVGDGDGCSSTCVLDGSPCPGDCNGDMSVTVDELLTMVNVALGNDSISLCRAADVDSDTQITVDEILGAVNNALNGCGH